MDLKGLEKLTEDLEIECLGAMSARDLVLVKHRLAERKAQGEEVEFEEHNLDLRVSPKMAYGVDGTLLVMGLPLAKPVHEKPKEPLLGTLSTFAVGEDYHGIFKRNLDIFLERLSDEGIAARAQVDTGPLLERAFAVEAGAGFQGKNSTMIRKDWGSLFFLGLVMLDKELDLQMERVPDGCKDCTICQKACPTQALDRPYSMQVNRCLSFWTQAKGHIPFWVRERWGRIIYGCDRCQQVCPYNHGHWRETAEPAKTQVDLVEVATMSKRLFQERFYPTAAGWRGRNILRRNALLALARPECKEAFDQIASLMADPSPVVRAYAGWTLVRMNVEEGRKLVTAAIGEEKDDFVREEWTLVLNWKSSGKMTDF